MMRKRVLTFIILFGSLFNGCSENKQQINVEVAFLGDVHFHDVYGEFQDNSFEGLPITADGEDKRAVIRTMQSQLTSTRLFNENYFAFVAALDSLVNRNIKIVALPGDISDDGQPLHLRGFREILEKYEREHKMRFFLTPGNHEPVKPYNNEAGKWNFLGERGKDQPIFSEGHPVCNDVHQTHDLINSDNDRQPPICSDEVIEFGYEGLFSMTGQFGYTPKPVDLYFETPFSHFEYSDYNYPDGLNASQLVKRSYVVCREGSRDFLQYNEGTSCFEIPDLSYLIEPVEGLWLLSLDINVYVPIENASVSQPEDPGNFHGSGNAGFNALITHKHHLLNWISDIHERADSLGKTVMVFSHYPAADFYDGAQPLIEKLWGEGRFQLARLPEKETTEILASHGMRIHVGAHMHMNDTHLFRNEETGDLLVNVQTPTLAGYVPGFKILSLKESRDSEQIEVETVILDEVPGFDTLFPLYETEWKMRSDQGLSPLWNRDILRSENYREYTNWHLQELSRLRFVPREWPEDFRNLLPKATGFDLLTIALLPRDLSILSTSEKGFENRNALHDLKRTADWVKAESEAVAILRRSQLSKEDFENWTGSELSVDFYRLRNAGSLALRDIEPRRLEVYMFLADQFGMNKTTDGFDKNNLHERFRLLFETLIRFTKGDPDRNFVIDFKSEQVLLQLQAE